MAFVMLTNVVEYEEKGFFAGVCKCCKKTRPMKAVDATMIKRVYGFKYFRKPVGSLAVCSFCEMEFPESNSLHPLIEGWQEHHGLESLVENTGRCYADMKALIPTNHTYDRQDKECILESISKRTQANLKDKGGLGALLGLFAGSFLGWSIAMSEVALQQKILQLILGFGVAGMVAGVILWRMMLLNYTAKKLARAVLTKHSIAAETLLPVARNEPRFKKVARILSKV